MNVLADTSAWVQFFRGEKRDLSGPLERGALLMHPAVAGELACGNLPARDKTLMWLDALPCATVATDEETRELIERKKLYGRGIGWVDACLVASALLSRASLLTFDSRLRSAARLAGVPCTPLIA